MPSIWGNAISATGHGHDRVAQAGIERGPHQHLHAAKRSTGDRSQMCNAQMIEDDLLGVDHVLDRRPGISRSVWMTAVRIDRGRRGGSEARAGQVDADDEVLLEVDALAVADQSIPPSGPIILQVGVFARGVSTGGQRVADEDRVGSIGIQLAERLVSDVERRNRLPVREAKSLLEQQIFWRRRDKGVLYELGHQAAR